MHNMYVNLRTNVVFTWKHFCCLRQVDRYCVSIPENDYATYLKVENMTYNCNLNQLLHGYIFKLCNYLQVV